MIPINRVTASLMRKKEEVGQLDMEGKVRWVWQMLQVDENKDVLNTESLWAKPSLIKCSVKAEELKKIGNKGFACRNLGLSLAAYNEALCHAPVPGSTFSLLVANRSQVLYELGQYSLALLDIELALENGYPALLRYKLWARQGGCRQALGDTTEARRGFEKARESFANLGQHAEDYKKAMAYIKQKEVEACQHNIESVQTSPSEERKTAGLEHPHPKYPAFTSKVDLKQTTKFGRHVVARETIKPGEIVGVDTAIVGILSPDKYSTNCMHCMASLVRMVPCLHCTAVMFCSAECRSKAMQSYHQFECMLGLGDLYQKVGQSLSGTGYLTLVMLVVVETNFDFSDQYYNFAS